MTVSSADHVRARILRPNDALASGVDQLGGKALQLARLSAAGFPVPEWRCIAADTFRSITAFPSVAAALDIARSAVDTDGSIVAGAIAPSETLRIALRDALQSDPHLSTALIDVLRDVGGPVAVRSSAIGEDGAAHSFAGQFETVLGVRTDGDLLDAVCSCWASALSDRVIAYKIRNGLDAFDAAMAVIVQRMVAADVAGVMFGADPMSGDPETVVISATWGLGEALVSGIVSADTYRVVWDGSIAVDVADKDVRIVMVDDATTREEPVPNEMRQRRALDDGRIRELADLARALEAEYGAPQDVEWAYDGNQIALLQSRAITTPVRPRGMHRLWDNSNIIESYGGVVSPLTFSFAREAYRGVYDQFVKVMGVRGARYEEGSAVFDQMLGYLDGRVYYNLRNWYVLISLLPGYSTNQRFMEQMMGVRERPDPRLLPDPPGAGRIRDALGLAEAGFRLWWNMRRLKHTIPPFRALVRELQLRNRDRLTTMSADELVDHFLTVQREALWNWRPPIVNDFGCMIAFGVLGKLVERYGLDDTGRLKNELLAGQGEVESTEPTRRLVEMAALVRADGELRGIVLDTADEALLDALRNHDTANGRRLVDLYDDYIDRFGDRCVNELKLETPTLRENPAFLLSVLRNYTAQEQLTIEAIEERERAVREAAEHRVAERLARRPIRRWWLGVWLRQARERVRQRENLRFDRTRVFGVARRVFVEIGRRFADAGLIAEPRDIFLLEVDEIIGIVRGTSTNLDVPGLVAVRKSALERAERDRPTLPDRIRTIGPALANELTAEQAATSIDGDTATGTGCCPGVVERAVRVVHAPDQGVQLAGDIMACERTDPGWVPLFPSCGGLLVERGSLLSHSAIVAREFGIPAIVGITGLMDWTRDGETLRMDGASGTVTRVNGAGHEP